MINLFQLTLLLSLFFSVAHLSQFSADVIALLSYKIGYNSCSNKVLYHPDQNWNISADKLSKVVAYLWFYLAMVNGMQLNHEINLCSY